MADIILDTNYGWSVCKTSTTCAGYVGSPTFPASDDTVYLGTTGTTGYVLTLDSAENATYTCVAIHAKAGDNKTTHNNGTIAITNCSTAPGPNLDFELYTGTVRSFILDVNKKINRVTKLVGGSGLNAQSMTINGSAVLGTATTVLGGTFAGCYGIMNYGTITEVTTTTGQAGIYGVCNEGSVGKIVNSNYAGLLMINNAAVVTTIDNAIATTGRSVYLYQGSIGTVWVATGGSTTNAYGIVCESGLIGKIGTLTGGAGVNAHGLYITNSTCSEITTVTGNVSSSGGYGLVVGSGGSVTLIGTSAGSGQHGTLNNGGTITITSAIGGATGHGLVAGGSSGGTATITSAKGSTTAGAYGVYGVAYQSGICTVNGTDLTGVGGAVGLGSSTSKLKMAANTAIGLWDSATGLSQILMPESTGVAASSDVLSGTPKWTGATTPNIGTMPIYMLKTGKI